MNNNTIKLAIDALSPEIVEAVFRASTATHMPFILSVTKDMVDYNSGLFWNTEKFIVFVNEMKQLYPDAIVFIMRKQCGFFDKNDTLESVYKTIDFDTRLGFNFIHLDLTNYKVDKSEWNKKFVQAVNFITKRSPNTQLILGSNLTTGDLYKVESDFHFYNQLRLPFYYVLNTGSKVKDGKQYNIFNPDKIWSSSSFLKENQISVMELEADYGEALKKKLGVIDTINLGTELGQNQTNVLIQQAQNLGIGYEPYLKTSYKTKKWKDLIYLTRADDESTCGMLCAHLNIDREYERIYRGISNKLDLKELLINSHLSIINKYLN
jgi:hypothetical protein